MLLSLTRFVRHRAGALALAIFLTGLAPVASFAANGSVAYTYDALGRIVTASYDTGACIKYTYDANGNRLSETIAVPPVFPTTYTGVWGCFTWGNSQVLWGP